MRPKIDEIKTLHQVSERRDIEKLRAGDPEAFLRLYRSYAAHVFSRLRALINDDHIVQELHQDVFLKIWERRASLKPDVSFQAVVMRTSKSIAVDFYRKSIRDKKMYDHLISKATEYAYDLEEQFDFQDTNARLQAAIAKLPPQRQKVFRRCKLDGQSYEAVAKEYNVSLSTVKDHMAKSMVFLKEELLKNDTKRLLLIISLFF